MSAWPLWTRNRKSGSGNCARASQLEKDAVAQRGELEQRIAFLQAEKTKSDKELQIQLSELQTQFTLKQAELEAVQTQLTAAQKDTTRLKPASGEKLGSRGGTFESGAA